ncbi:MAG TPA: hypothetical protein VN083_11780, partial [Vicinamibacteria bacterium]|nr:hypothetical protein [Vicinamibacteria bacterium]
MLSPSRTRCSTLLLSLVAALAMAAPAGAQLPACNATDRHFDPAVQPAAPVGPGTTYYVDATGGNDSNNGKSLSSAFKTIGKALGQSLKPGDTVLIKAGLYRERTLVQNSGNSTSPIMIGALGDGPVVIDASNAVTGWALSSGEVYKAH